MKESTIELAARIYEGIILHGMIKFGPLGEEKTKELIRDSIQAAQAFEKECDKTK